MPRQLILLLLLWPLSSAADSTLQNQLADNPSAYLAMHAGDPVKWQLWDQAAVERARREDKLLYISIGYFSCHWCHVMQKESYRNPEIAGVLNAGFVPVKVDRELNPALDAHLIEFVERTRGYSGWPLNVFVTPEGHPLLGIVYLPPGDFLELTRNLQKSWQQERHKLKGMAAAAAEVMQPPELRLDPALAAGLGERYEKALLHSALTLADETSGGFGSQNKFPQVPQLMALLAVQRHRPDPRLREFLQTTLDQMMQRGLHDMLGGGFFRYTVDPDWRTPHFEKMLYDNALLADLYLAAAAVLGNPAYEQQARRTLDFMLRELGTGTGAFAASLSAVDDHNVEGGYYLWDDATLEKLLTKDELQVARLAWDMHGAAALEAGHLPIRSLTPVQVADTLKLDAGAVKKRLDSAQKKLLEARRQRQVPKDSKMLAAWNGLALSALSHAAQLDDAGRYRRAAGALRDFLVTTVWDGKALKRAVGKQGAFGEAALEDYAYVASGLVAWAGVSGSQEDLRIATAMIRQALQRFLTAHGWRLSEKPLIAHGGHEAVIADGPLPSPSATLLAAAIQLARSTGDTGLRQQALAALNTAHDRVASEPFWYASQVAAVAGVQSDTK
jgi:uncharacterized protein YyaL (SSP411 family)